MTGRLIAVVGPSGVGKDSVMPGIAVPMPAVKLVRRTITRNPELGGEVFDPLTPEAFAKAAAGGAFCVHWGAHDLYYGIPARVLSDVNAGALCLANLSRSALPDTALVFPDMVVLNITAQPETLARRLAARGRETADQIAKRLAQASKPVPNGLPVLSISNDGALSETVAAAVKALQPVRV